MPPAAADTNSPREHTPALDPGVRWAELGGVERDYLTALIEFGMLPSRHTYLCLPLRMYGPIYGSELMQPNRSIIVGRLRLSVCSASVRGYLRI